MYLLSYTTATTGLAIAADGTDLRQEGLGRQSVIQSTCKAARPT